LAQQAGPLDFDTHLRPLIAADLALGYYHELWHAHPERVVGSWESFVERLADFASAPPAVTSGPRWGTDRLAEAAAAAVPDPADRLDLDLLERPLDMLAISDPVELRLTLLDYMADDLERRTDPAHSANLGLFLALLSCFGQLGIAAAQGLLSARSLALVDGSYFAFLSYLASGPPPPRLEQLSALARAGLVEFLGPDLTIEADPERGCFRATRAFGPAVEAHALIEARLPAPSVSRDLDPLIACLFARGECVEDVRRDPEDGFVYETGRLRTDSEHRIVDAEGRPHPARYALGPWTSGGRFSSGIARPRLNAAFFRQNDALARAVLSHVGPNGAHDQARSAESVHPESLHPESVHRQSVDPDQTKRVGDRLGLVG
jgi:hypothetical protein